MLATIFSDLHAHTYADHDTKGSRLQNCLKVLRMIFKFNHKQGIKYTLFAGDMYDTQKAIPTEVVNEVIATLKQLFEEYPEQTVIAITGNHDQASKSLWHQPAVSALTHLNTVFGDRFSLIDNGFYQLGSKANDLEVHGIPYYEFPEDFLKALQARAEDAGDNSILLIHQTPSGLYNDSIPFDVDINNPLFKKFKYVYCGHIHQRQDINEKFTVIGTQLHRDLGDEGDEKGFLVMDMLEPEAGYQFISTRGKFPEFVRAKASEFGAYEGQYMVVIPEIDTTQRTKEAKVEEFNTSLKSEDLVTNYWTEAGGGDKKLLETGLSLLR